MILVTGGTGLVGSHLLYSLIEQDKPVRAIHRKESDLKGVEKIFSLYTSEPRSFFDKIEWVEADIIDIPALTDAFEGVTDVYHCAAMINFNSSNYRKLKKVNIEGTANIVNLSLANKVNKIAYVSSVATLGNASAGTSVSEETAFNADEKNNVYSLTKYGAEMEVWRGSQEGLDAVIVNPGIILGSSPNKNFSGSVTTLGAKGIRYYPTGGMGFVDVQDVVRALILLMESTIRNEQFILVSENLSYREIQVKLAQLYGKKPPSQGVSKSTVRVLSAVDWLMSIFGKKRQLPQSMVDSMFSFPKYDAAKIQETLNYEFRSVDETLSRMVKEDQRLKE